MGSQPCKRKRLTEVLKAPKPSPAKTDSCNPFHNRTQDRTKERENWTVLDLGGLVHLEVNSDPQYIGALNVPMRLPKLPSHNNNRAEKSFQAFNLSDNKPRMGRRHRAPWSAAKKSFWVFITLRQWSPQVKAATKCYNRAEKSFQAFKLSDNKPRMGRRHRAPWSAVKKSFWVFITLRQWSPQVKAATKCYNRAEKSFQAFKLSDNKPRMGRRHRAPWSAAKKSFWVFITLRQWSPQVKAATKCYYCNQSAPAYPWQRTSKWTGEPPRTAKAQQCEPKINNK